MTSVDLFARYGNTTGTVIQLAYTIVGWNVNGVNSIM